MSRATQHDDTESWPSALWDAGKFGLKCSLLAVGAWHTFWGFADLLVAVRPVDEADRAQGQNAASGNPEKECLGLSNLRGVISRDFNAENRPNGLGQVAVSEKNDPESKLAPLLFASAGQHPSRAEQKYSDSNRAFHSSPLKTGTMPILAGESIA